MTPTLIALIGTYIVLGLPVAWIYLAEISPQTHESNDPVFHVAGTIILLFFLLIWPIVLPGWQLDKAAVKRR